jgi:hypothetical protein
MIRHMVPIALFLPLSVFAQGLRVDPDARDCFHSVQLGAFDSATEAQERLREAHDTGLSPVYLLEDEETSESTVYYGVFDFAADAHLHERFLRESGLEWEIQIRELSALPENINGEDHSPLPSMFSISRDELGGHVSLGTLGSPDLAREQARQLLDSSTGDSDPSRGAALVALGQHAAQRGDHADALQLQRVVAEGEVAADAATRLRACWHMAEAFFATQRYEDAYQAFCELEAFCSEPLDQARSVEQQILIMQRLTQSGIGSALDFGRRSEQLLAQFPEGDGEMHDLRATALLAQAQSLYLTGQPGECINAVERFNVTHGDCHRQLATGRLYQGFAFMYQGPRNPFLLTQADTCFRLVSEVPLGSDAEDRFGHNPVREALYNRANIARLLHDQEALRTFADQITETWPESSEATGVEVLLHLGGEEVQ